MGQGLSCRGSHEHGLFRAVQHGDLDTVAALLHTHPSLMNHTTVYDHHSPLHIAAANGQIQVPLSSFSISSHAISQFGIRFHSFFSLNPKYLSLSLFLSVLMFFSFFSFSANCCRFYHGFWMDL